MSEARHGLPELRRLVVALGGPLHNETALLLAARLAQRLNAELSGLFLEDAELIDVAALPVTALLSFQARERRRFDLVSMERGFRVEARRLQSLVASVSERHLVRWSFEVRRVRSCEEIARRLGREELLVIAPQGRAERRRRLGEAMACQAVPAILILPPGRPRAPDHVALLYDGSDSVLSAGAHLAGALEAPISVIPVGEGPAHEEARLRRWRQNLSWPNRVMAAVPGDFEYLRVAMNRLDPDIVVLARSGRAVSKLTADALDELIGPRALLIAPEAGSETVSSS